MLLIPCSFPPSPTTTRWFTPDTPPRVGETTPGTTQQNAGGGGAGAQFPLLPNRLSEGGV